MSGPQALPPALLPGGWPLQSRPARWWRRIARTRCSMLTRTTPSSGTGCWPMRPQRRAKSWRIGRHGGSRRATAGSARSGNPSEARVAGPDRRPRRPLRRGRRGRAGPSRVCRRRAERTLAHRHHGAQNCGRQALPLRDQGRVLRSDRGLLHRLENEVPPGSPSSRTLSRCAATSPAASSTATGAVNFEAGNSFVL